MNFDELYNELNKLKDRIKTGAEDGLKSGAVRVSEAARAKPGSYQPAVPPYPAWAKLKKGDSPLLKSGRLRGSISITESGETQYIGVSGYGSLHESGTEKIPQRAFLGPAMIENKEKVKADVIEGIRAGVR